METHTYQGWTNYATWGVALVLDNDESSHGAVRSEADAIRGEGEDGYYGSAEWKLETLASYLESFVEDLCGLEADPGPSLMARQVLGAGLAEVNWDEIAANLLAEAEEGTV